MIEDILKFETSSPISSMASPMPAFPQSVLKFSKMCKINQKSEKSLKSPNSPRLSIEERLKNLMRRFSGQQPRPSVLNPVIEEKHNEEDEEDLKLGGVIKIKKMENYKEGEEKKLEEEEDESEEEKEFEGMKLKAKNEFKGKIRKSFDFQSIVIDSNDSLTSPGSPAQLSLISEQTFKPENTGKKFYKANLDSRQNPITGSLRRSKKVNIPFIQLDE